MAATLIKCGPGLFPEDGTEGTGQIFLEFKKQ